MPDARATLALVSVAAVALGGFTGRRLLDSANAPHAATLALLRDRADAPAPPSGPTRPVVIALVDGLREDTADRLAREGAFGPHLAWSARVDVGLPSLSRPVYHALLTGAPQSLAGVGNNAHHGAARLDTLAQRARDAGVTVRWALAGVPWMHELAGLRSDPYELGVGALDRWSRSSRDGLSVLHLTAVDAAGHHRGGASGAYLRAARDAAATVRRLREGGPRGAVWFVGADHGHLDVGGHGGPEPAVTHVRWVAFTDDATPAMTLAGRYPVERLAATFAAAMGVAPPRHATGAALPTPFATTTDPPQRARRARDAGVVFREEVRAERRAGEAALTAFVAALYLASRRRRAEVLTALSVSGLAAAMFVAVMALRGAVSLSSITTHAVFVGWSLAAMTAGATVASLAWARRASPTAAVLWSTAWPLAALAYTRGTLGAVSPGPVTALLLPASGLVPAGVVTGVAVAVAVRRLRQSIAS